jgi:hypothetical protein
MSKTRQNIEEGLVASVLNEKVGSKEMDRLLALKRDDIDGKLREAFADSRNGDVAPLEPLHVILEAAREGLEHD